MKTTSAHPVRVPAGVDPDLAAHHPTELTVCNEIAKVTAQAKLDNAVFIAGWDHRDYPPIDQFARTDVAHG